VVRPAVVSWSVGQLVAVADVLALGVDVSDAVGDSVGVLPPPVDGAVVSPEGAVVTAAPVVAVLALGATAEADDPAEGVEETEVAATDAPAAALPLGSTVAVALGNPPDVGLC
jgi:hypothetical protein